MHGPDQAGSGWYTPAWVHCPLLAALPLLASLYASQVDVQSLAVCTALTHLLFSCHQAEDAVLSLTPLASCTALQELGLYCFLEVTSMGPLASCTRLSSVVIQQFSRLVDIGAVAAWNYLSI